MDLYFSQVSKARISVGVSKGVDSSASDMQQPQTDPRLSSIGTGLISSDALVSPLPGGSSTQRYKNGGDGSD
jgi:hypothetical protein